MKHRLASWRPVWSSPWFWLVLAGYGLRILLQPFSAQHDALFMPWMTHYLALGHWNLYAYLYDTFGPGVVQGPFVWAPYPYGFYLYTAGWLTLLDRLHLIHLASWDQVWGVPHVARYLFLAKLAYLPWDALIAFLLYRLGGKCALALWAWSPLAFYTPFIMGQNDVYATALSVLGTYAAAQAVVHPQRASRWMAGAAFSLGLGSSFKLYPLFLLPPLILWGESRWSRRALWLALGLIPLTLVVLPFVRTPAFQQGVLFSPEGSHVFDVQVLGATRVSPFLVAWLLVLAYPLLVPAPRRPEQAWAVSALVLGLFFVWINLAFYWVIWLMPFVIALTVWKPWTLWAWGAWQLAWAARLPWLHADFGAGLLKNVVPASYPVNLPTALALTHPDIYRLAQAVGLPLVDSLSLAALLLVLGAAVWLLYAGPSASTEGAAERPPLWLFIPATTLALMLAINVGLARSLNVVAFTGQYWDKLTLQAGQTLTQRLPLDGATQVTGVRLRLMPPVTPMSVEVCLLPTLDGTPLTCLTRSTQELLDGVHVYGLLEQFSWPESAPLYVRLRPQGAGTLTLRMAVGKDLEAHVDGASLNGAAELFALTPLRPGAIAQQIRLALSDGILLALQSLTLMGLGVALTWLCSTRNVVQ